MYRIQFKKETDNDYADVEGMIYPTFERAEQTLKLCQKFAKDEDFRLHPLHNAKYRILKGEA
tara:strand:+ start:160 stop:345 length:186 start_codon:yes stop_codon:yes gene_type:complete